VLHIPIWVFEAFSGVLSGDGTRDWNFGPPVVAWATQLGGMECGWYGSASWIGLVTTLRGQWPCTTKAYHLALKSR